MAKRTILKPDLTLKGRDGSLWQIELKLLWTSGKSENEFAEILRNAIKNSGISQYHLSKASGVPQGTISVFLAGGDLRLATFTRLAKIMGMELQQNLAKAPRKIKSAGVHPKPKA